jgi:hypothetical protein
MPDPLRGPSPHPAVPSRGRQPADGDHHRASRTGQDRPLEVLDRSFRLLVCEPAPLALDGGWSAMRCRPGRSSWTCCGACCCTPR